MQKQSDQPDTSVDQPSDQRESRNLDQTRREFVARLGLTVALPVVSTLSLTWSKEAKAY
jgi:hypothetical protein